MDEAAATTPSSSGTAVETHDRSSSWVPPRKRQVFTTASTMINNGGLGDPSTSTSTSTSPSLIPPPPNTFPPSSSPSSSDISSALETYEKQFHPHQPKSLSGIALRAFLLGLTLALSSLLTIYLLSIPHPLWRAPLSLASLSLFHFLEFYTTALTNVPSATVSSFLLSSNGSAYMIAHLASITECLLSHLLLPSQILPPLYHTTLLVLGLLLIVLGQIIRAAAMLTAGTNFSHFVKRHKTNNHRLVTNGIYAYFRHPSYFGYFWWGIGTQLVYGNLLCLLAFGVVLWRFFSRRIEGEEELLVRFFGDDYARYKRRTWVGIPFIK